VGSKHRSKGASKKSDADYNYVGIVDEGKLWKKRSTKKSSTSIVLYSEPRHRALRKLGSKRTVVLPKDSPVCPLLDRPVPTRASHPSRSSSLSRQNLPIP
jgi:hypothetical protein